MLFNEGLTAGSWFCQMISLQPTSCFCHTCHCRRSACAWHAASSCLLMSFALIHILQLFLTAVLFKLLIQSTISVAFPASIIDLKSFVCWQSSSSFCTCVRFLYYTCILLWLRCALWRPLLGSVIHVQFPTEWPFPVGSLKAPPSPPYPSLHEITSVSGALAGP